MSFFCISYFFFAQIYPIAFAIYLFECFNYSCLSTPHLCYLFSSYFSFFLYEWYYVIFGIFILYFEVFIGVFMEREWHI